MSNGMVHEAFQYQRQRRNTSNASEMMQYFYDRAEKLGKLDSVLQMSLMLVEERELVDFLQRSDRPSSQEVLLMYYLQVTSGHILSRLPDGKILSLPFLGLR